MDYQDHIAALSATVGQLLRTHDIEGASAHLEKLLHAENCDRFVSLAESHFSNTPASVLQHINSFIAVCEEEFDVKSIYLPHNGFVCNYECWFFDSSGYDQFHDVSDDYEWLCYPRLRNCDTFTLTGLERTQADFGWYIESELYDQPSWLAVADIAELLVKVRFVQLIKSSLAAGRLVKPIPILVTAYDCDFYCSFVP
jgi:hypothetical protein